MEPSRRKLLLIVAPMLLVATGLMALFALRPYLSKPFVASASPTVRFKWKFETSGPILGSPAIGDDGTIYVGSGDGYLYAVSPDGQKRWEYKTGSIESSPIFASDTIYVANIDGEFFAFNTDGSKRWSVSINSHRDRTAPAISPVNIYASCWRGAVCALNPMDGAIRWQSEGFHTSERTAPIILPEGMVVVGALRGRVLALSPVDGSIQWGFPDAPKPPLPEYPTGVDTDTNSAELARGAMNAPAADGQGTIFVGGSDKNLYALSFSGTEKWHFATQAAVDGSVALSKDGTIYFGSEDSKLYALTAEGAQKWAFDTFNKIESTPALAADGTIYVGDGGGQVYALSQSGSLKWSCNTQAGGIRSSPAIASDGTVYVTTMTGKLYAIPGSGSGLERSPWPKFHHDNGNTGQAANQ